MRVVRFEVDGGRRYGVVEGNEIFEISDPFGNLRPTGPVRPLEGARLLAPIRPTKIVLASTNYHSVAKQMGREPRQDPIIFMKPTTALAGPEDQIVYPRQSTKVTYEPELAVVIKRRCRNVSAEEAPSVILGYTCLNDVSALDLVERDDWHYTRGKGFDGFAPIGPWIETELDPSDIQLAAYLNGSRTITTPTNDMIVPPLQLVSIISSVMTLLPGDVISTGASGIEEMRVGDTIEIEVEGIGRLRNRVVAEESGDRRAIDLSR